MTGVSSSPSPDITVQTSAVVIAPSGRVGLTLGLIGMQALSFRAACDTALRRRPRLEFEPGPLHSENRARIHPGRLPVRPGQVLFPKCEWSAGQLPVRKLNPAGERTVSAVLAVGVSGASHSTLIGHPCGWDIVSVRIDDAFDGAEVFRMALRRTPPLRRTVAFERTYHYLAGAEAADGGSAHHSADVRCHHAAPLGGLAPDRPVTLAVCADLAGFQGAGLGGAKSWAATPFEGDFLTRLFIIIGRRCERIGSCGGRGAEWCKGERYEQGNGTHEDGSRWQ